VSKGGDRIKIEGVADGGHFDEFISEVTVRGRLLHLETEQDNVLPEREPPPRIASRKPFHSTASQHHSPFNELNGP